MTSVLTAFLAMVSKGSKQVKAWRSFDCSMLSELISTSLLFDLFSRERVQWSIRLIFILANCFALLTSFLANVVNPNTPPCTCRHRTQCTPPPGCCSNIGLNSGSIWDCYGADRLTRNEGSKSIARPPSVSPIVDLERKTGLSLTAGHFFGRLQ